LKRRIVVRPEARAELSEAAAWYRNKSPAVAATFKADVREALIKISEWPGRFCRNLARNPPSADEPISVRYLLRR
jgi:hypothetical protein